MKTTRLGIAIFAVLLVVGIGMMLMPHRSVRVDSELVRRETLEPYAAAIARSDYELAWSRYTTPAYRARHPLHALQENYARLVSSHGPIVQTNCARIVGLEQTRENVFVAAYCERQFRDGHVARVVYTVTGRTRNGGEDFQIDGATESDPSGRPQSPEAW